MNRFYCGIVLGVFFLLFVHSGEAHAQFGNTCHIGSWELPARSEWRCTFRQTNVWEENVESLSGYWLQPTASPALLDEDAAESMPRFRREVAPGSESEAGTWTATGDLSGFDSFAIHVWCHGHRSAYVNFGLDGGFVATTGCEDEGPNQFPAVWGRQSISWGTPGVEGYWYTSSGWDWSPDSMTRYRSVRVTPGKIEVFEHVMSGGDTETFDPADEENWVHVLTYELQSGWYGDVAGLSEDCCDAIVNKLHDILTELETHAAAFIDYKGQWSDWREDWDSQDEFIRLKLTELLAALEDVEMTVDWGSTTGSSLSSSPSASFERHEGEGEMKEEFATRMSDPPRLFSLAPSDSSTPPVWSFTIPVNALESALGSPMGDRTYEVDFAFSEPFMPYIHAVILVSVTLASLSRVWAELRRQ